MLQAIFSCVVYALAMIGAGTLITLGVGYLKPATSTPATKPAGNPTDPAAVATAFDALRQKYLERLDKLFPIIRDHLAKPAKEDDYWWVWGGGFHEAKDALLDIQRMEREWGK